MAARLEVIAGNAVGSSIVVEDELVVGRSAEGPGRLAADEEISRLHARVTVEANGTCAIEDLGSTNGTFLNGVRISTPQILAEGDTIELGATTLVVRQLPQPVPMPARAAPAAGLQSTVVPGAPPRPPAEAAPADVEEPPTVSRPPAGIAPEPAGVAAQPPPPVEQRVTTPRPPLSLLLTVNFTAREARIALDGESEPLRLIFENGVWRSAPIPPNQEG